MSNRNNRNKLLTDLCWSTIFSNSSSRSFSSFSTASRSTDSCVLEPGTAPLHWIQFLFFFSISPMPSSTLVMSYIRRFCFTFSVSAAWKIRSYFQISIFNGGQNGEGWPFIFSKIDHWKFFVRDLPLLDLRFLRQLLAKVWQILW